MLYTKEWAYVQQKSDRKIRWKVQVLFLFPNGIFEEKKSFSCSKCSTDDTNFVWKILLHLTLSDFTDSISATCFQVRLAHY